jgi:hypothetical protein
MKKYKRLMSLILAATLLLSLASCAKAPAPAPSAEPTPAEPQTPPPSALPPLPEKLDYIMEDTIVISRDGDDFVVSSAGLGVTQKDVAEAYGRELNSLVAEELAKHAPAPEGGDIRFGTSYREAYERIYGEQAENEDLTALITDHTNSYAGALCQLSVQFNSEKKVSFIGLWFRPEDDSAATWFELYRKFTELFGAPSEALGTGAFSNTDELRALIEEGKMPGIIWGGEEKNIFLRLQKVQQGPQLVPAVTVQMVWRETSPSQQG